MVNAPGLSLWAEQLARMCPGQWAKFLEKQHSPPMAGRETEKVSFDFDLLCGAFFEIWSWIGSQQ